MRQFKRRVKKIESMVNFNTDVVPPRELNLSEKEIVEAYKKASKYDEPLYVKNGAEYFAIHSLDAFQLQKSYRDFIDGRTALFSESELTAMGMKTSQAIGRI